jgi:hypothetical protein
MHGGKLVVPMVVLLTMFNTLPTDYQMDTVEHLVILGVMLYPPEIMWHRGV